MMARMLSEHQPGVITDGLRQCLSLTPDERVFRSERRLPIAAQPALATTFPVDWLRPSLPPLQVFWAAWKIGEFGSIPSLGLMPLAHHPAASEGRVRVAGHPVGAHARREGKHARFHLLLLRLAQRVTSL